MGPGTRSLEEGSSGDLPPPATLPDAVHPGDPRLRPKGRRMHVSTGNLPDRVCSASVGLLTPLGIVSDKSANLFLKGIVELPASQTDRSPLGQV